MIDSFKRSCINKAVDEPLKDLLSFFTTVIKDQAIHQPFENITATCIIKILLKSPCQRQTNPPGANNSAIDGKAP
jgi:hypothetical protein